MSNAAKRDKIIAKVQALLTKTIENGCTEDEALAATEAAARLMEEYDGRGGRARQHDPGLSRR